MEGVRTSDFKDLKVWQKAVVLASETYNLCKLLPQSELHALSNQMRRSAVSISSNIAEGQGRDSVKEFIRFLLVARGSACELESQCYVGVEIGYFTMSDISIVTGLCIEVGKMITSLIAYLYNLQLKTNK